MRHKSFASLLACSLAALSAAQSRSVPYVISIDDIPFDVGYDFMDLQPAYGDPAVKLVKYKGCVKVTASQNTQSLRLMCASIDGTPKTPTLWRVHRTLPSGAGIGGGQLSFLFQRFTEFYMPSLDVSAKEAAFFEMDFEASDVVFDGFLGTTEAERRAVKAQKMWLPCNFRVAIGDLPAARVNKVSAFTIKLGTADLDGDGDADFTIPDDIAITLPVEDAGPYLEWFRTSGGSSDGGAGGSDASEAKMLDIEYQDGDGIPVLTVSVRVTIESLGFSDMFLGTSPTPGREIQATLKAKGIISARPGTSTPK